MTKLAVEKVPMALVGMLLFLPLTIKGVYDCTFDPSIVGGQAYFRWNFLCALVDSLVLIIVWRVNLRLTHRLGVLAGIFSVILMGQMAIAMYLHSKYLQENIHVEENIHLNGFLFQLAAF